MSITYYGYPNCGTCKKAKAWLDAEGVSYHDVHIVETPPSKEQLRKMVEISELPLKKFYNTSGMKYRELGLKDKISTMTDDEQFELLASDGMLIKRPLVTNGLKATVGFKESNFTENWKS
ncbi:arsenate reductase family protein [Paenisporosarcina antarctica]|uniref:Arsenate reductase family protein n=1 Tax=Paenisporosarcina antarctica TaxID=417367 RepID=A0A4P6ZVZ4_9BACL|nr:arsenate reductase family protein [Paenisporosarcina antarctica]QBP40522.1 arsenate reductase family protein [Paenisporosarcina antarctica]